MEKREPCKQSLSSKLWPSSSCGLDLLTALDSKCQAAQEAAIQSANLSRWHCSTSTAGTPTFEPSEKSLRMLKKGVCRVPTRLMVMPAVWGASGVPACRIPLRVIRM